MPPAEVLQPLLFTVGIAVLAWVLMRRSLNNIRSTPTAVPKTLLHNGNRILTPNQFRGTDSLGAPPEVLRWQVELHDLGRELKAEIDSKMLAVHTLLRSCDQATKRLGELMRLADQSQSSTRNLFAQVRSLADEGWSASRIAPVVGMERGDVETIIRVSSVPTPPLGVRHELPLTDSTPTGPTV